MTTALPQNPARSGRLQTVSSAPVGPAPAAASGTGRQPGPQGGRKRRGRRDRRERAAGDYGDHPAPAPAGRLSFGAAVLYALPGTWVLGVLVFALTVGDRAQLTPLLAAAPAIACAASGRRPCVVVGCAFALLAVVPVSGPAASWGQRICAAAAILVVALSSFLVTHRRIRLQRTLDQVRRIADVAQRVLLRPVPARIGPVAAAVGYLAAAPGARIGGDFYEVLETPFGLRAILGDMRGNGLDAVSGAAALLGAFREAGAVEPELTAVAGRLDAALTRHAVAVRSEQDCAGPDLRTEDFATAVLVQLPPGSGAAELVVCGHPAPYLVESGGGIRLLTPVESAPPLGLRILVAAPQLVTSFTVNLDPGESLVCYTDGITESRDRSGAFFPLAEVLAAGGGEEPEAIAQKVRTHLFAHTRGTMHDDAAVLVLRRLDTCGC